MRLRKLNKVVVDGFRSVEEVNIFRKNFDNFKLIFIDATEENRFRRRKLEDPNADLESFRQRDQRDMKEKGLGKVTKTANIVIDNNEAREELHKKLDKLI
jgi:dephospho-CoA kinase